MPAAIFPGLARDELGVALADERLRAAFARGRLPLPLSAPPAIVDGGAISGATRTTSPSGGRFRYLAGAPYRSPYADWMGLRTVSYGAGADDFAQIGGSVEFMSDAPQIQLLMVGDNTPYRLWVDDGPIAPAPGTRLYHDASKPLIDWDPVAAAPVARRYRIDFGSGGKAALFAGAAVDARYDIWTPARATPLRCVVAGDSFTEGTTADADPTLVSGLSGFANHLGWLLGIDDLWCSGSGGTGWVQTNGPRMALPDRFDRDVITPKPDLAVVAAGINDGNHPPEAVEAAALACVRRFRAALPASPLVLVAPWAPQGTRVAGMHEAIAAAALGDGTGRTVFVPTDAAGAEWQWPAAGTTGAPTGVGNGDWAVDVYGTHPTTAGHAYLGARLADAIKAALAPAVFPASN